LRGILRDIVFPDLVEALKAFISKSSWLKGINARLGVL
jgi:hypothetical protein